MDASSFDVIVLGGGTMGTAAAWELGKRGVRTLVLEQFDHVHNQGAHPIITARTHIPSGRVSLASVVRFAIEELGVRPLRPDWATVLAKEERTLPLDSGG